ncbi:hypothetical protein F511_42233 [Dorcoceras hygrometricum]|uniref:Dystroglycan-like n=1 Tax=Dorcoceras hygrometricum TaxID=472368 RepID=A0A2Z7ANQ7_9LAMI|nr:hypothetical protein F511_42233 [Dorcoceras hygrometricum]
MASSLLSRSHHIDFDSVFRIDDAGIVQMFESLVSTGLMEFLGCPAIFYEQALIEFFDNGSVRDGMVVSTINGTAIEISESVFAAAFGLPTEGLTDLSEVPRDHLSNAQKLFSASEKEVSASCLKKEVKMQFRLLSDILAKSLFVKAGSFDAVTRDRFLLMTAITFDVKVNWGNILFGVLKEMVTPDSRQAKGYAIQICVLLKNIPGLELGESKAFPAPRILNEKSVHRIVSVNENVGEVGDAPRAKPTPVKRTVSKKRQASIDADVAPIIKKKRTTKIKPVAAKKLVLEETIAAIPSTEESLPVKEITFEDADATIRQVLTQLDLVFEPQDDVHRGRDETWFDRAFDEAFVAENQEDQASESLEHIFLELDAAGTKEVGDSSKRSAASKQSVEEIMSVDDLLVQICDDLKLPFITHAEISKIKVGESIALRDKGKGILVEDELIQSNPAQEAVDIICGDVEFLVELRDRVMVDVVEFFHSFSLNKLTDLDALLALKAKEKLMLEWAETDSLETAVKRRLFILSKTLLDYHRHYLVTGQPWTALASQTFDLLSAVHSDSLDALRTQQQEHGIFLEQPCSSTAVDYAGDCSAVFARFFSVARSTCWVRPLICLDGIWTPLQGPDFWRSGSRLSLFLNKVEMSAPAVQDIFGHSVSFLEPTQYWEAAPFLHKTWAWHCVCTEVFPFTISGRLRPANRSADIVMYSFDVQKLPAYLLDDFQRGLHTDCFASYFGSSDALSDSKTHSDSSSGCTVYRSPSPGENLFALGPAIFSRVNQVEQPYFVQSPISPPAAFSPQESSSSSSNVSIHFDSEDLPMRAPEAAHTSAPGDSHASSAALEDLRSYFSKRIDESTTELRSKVNESTQLKDLKKGLLAPVSTIFQDLLDLKRNDRAHEAKLNALDGQVAALRNDQLEFQNRISADLLSLSTQFADIVEFIRGGDAKKGESGSSSRPPPVRVERRNLPIPPSPRDAAGTSGAARIPAFPRTTGTLEERIEQARRHLLQSGLVISVEEAAERIRQADIQESDRFQRERERARREKRSSSSRRRRGS